MKSAITYAEVLRKNKTAITEIIYFLRCFLSDTLYRIKSSMYAWYKYDEYIMPQPFKNIKEKLRLKDCSQNTTEISENCWFDPTIR